MAEDKIFTVNAWKALLNNLITRFKTKDFTAKEKLTIGSSEIYNKANGEQLDFSKVETKGITKIGDLKEEYVFEANQTAIVADTSLEGTAGYTESGLYVDTTTGKYSTNNNWKQVNKGTKIYIPMYSTGTLIVNFYYSGTINVGLEETREVSVKAGNTEIEIFDSDIITFENNKYVVITIGNNNYINYIKTTSQKTVYSIEINEEEVNIIKNLVVQETVNILKNLAVKGTMDVLNDLNVGHTVTTKIDIIYSTAILNSNNFEGTIGTFGNLTIDATNGKWWTINGYKQINKGTILYLPYKGDGTLVIVTYSDPSGSYTVNGNTLNITPVVGVKEATGTAEIKESECVDGKIKIICTEDGYIAGPITYNYSASMPLVSIKDGRISHGGNRTDDLKNQKIPFFKEITQEEYDNLETKDEDVVYLIEE